MSDEDLSQDELDLAQFASLLDTCLTSDNEAVQNALRGLLTIATIVTAKKPGDELVRGPLRRLIDQVARLNSRVQSLENDLSRYRNGSPGYPGKDYYGSPNTWPGIVDPSYNQPYRPFSVGDSIFDKGATSIRTSNIDTITEMMRKLKE